MATISQPPQKDDLPADIWFEIAILLEPRDLLTMKLVCTALYKMFTDLDLWKYVLHAVCHRHSLFVPSFPIDDMNIGELQRAALGPHRWSKLLERNALPLVDKKSGPLLEPLVENDYPFGITTASRQFLVPGGRFLVIASRESLGIWDLGTPGRPITSPPPLIARESLATLPEHSEMSLGLHGLEVVPVNDDTIRIAVALSGKVTL
ncbi:hypothetical protein DFP72DRAFT_234275 [Ephemerocybe angulata]|uniref:F-box domain-containing protein n=1 Tax=Ephemerocybe angulata TaxID=980116 RepID=A0A8H6I3T1_9AGAR|nr:hypothetical protein DFP72DRAFT_234275 [Tulosesus angulatus]